MMGKSYRKTPKYGITGAKGQGKFKRQENRRKRRIVKQTLDKSSDDAELPHEKEFGNEWDSPRDGKVYDEKSKEMRRK